MTINRDFKQKLCDRFTAAELADFLDISTEEFCEMFEEEIEMNYDELAEWIGLRKGDDADSEDYR